MHFKSAVILCMLYFVTVTQSAGINKRQAKDIVSLFKEYETYKNEIPKQNIWDLGLKLGMKSMSHFTYNTDVSDAHKAQDLLILLADNDKSSDCWQKENVSSFEVTIIVTVFRKFDQKRNNDGLIDYEELKDLIASLSLGQKFKDDLAGQFSTNDKTINAVELVKAYLEVKPQDGSLDKIHIDELAKLKENKTGNQINPLGITDFFIKLSIVGEDLKDLLSFTTTREAALELQELLVVIAEYSKGEKDEAIPVNIVRQIVWQFDQIDKDKDGLLNTNELKKINSGNFEDKDLEKFFKDHDTNKDSYVDIIEFLYALIDEDKGLPSINKF
ncbi:uncharacterized protein LOC126833238 [Adelges cooleyi]|uniref:uncharacterized protein LOC126833238 n=1 Tax=Adelges cooleyi TaxID=133065 RepID=UPI00217FBD56|nr:uncharacterized protein LOC126833238 [Adelges cooleyi]